jgi:hypothetical protein
MSESIPPSGRHQNESRSGARQEGRSAASVGAVVRGDKGQGRGILGGGEQCALACRLEIARQQDRSTIGGFRAQREAAIVQRTASILRSGVEDIELEGRAPGRIAALQSQNGDPTRHRIGRDAPRQRIPLRPRADPQLADFQVAQHRACSARVIVVIVR